MRRCVVVEDAELVGSVLGAQLTEWGWETVIANRPDEALEMMSIAATNIVLLDWDLPNLGALDVLAGMAPMPDDQRPHVLIMMAECDPKQIALAREAGVTDTLEKPIDHHALKSALERSLASCAA
ncbi:MAG: response regulator [Pseudomonadota bacterium]